MTDAAIRFFCFTQGGSPRIGVECAGAHYDATDRMQREFAAVSLGELIETGRLGDAARLAAEANPLPPLRGDFRWCVPLPRPGKIVAMVQNYKKHAQEFGNQAPSEPVWFAKVSSSLCANEEPVHVPGWIEGRVDHEVELAVIVGRRAHNLAEADALSCVAGYSILNDVSARRIQKDDRENKHPWTRCKNFDTFTPMGPYIVPAAFVPDPQALAIRCRVNGETRQEATTADMIHPVARILSAMSRYMTLLPGDVVATGTPEGVSNLRDGDLCECEIEGLGVLRNPVVRR